jgi:hypothetical protein
MRSRPTLFGLIVASLLGTACTSGSRSPRDSAAVRPPALLSSPRPEWRYPLPPRDGRVLDLRIEVQVDGTGQPDLETLRVTGLGADQNRDLVAGWLRNSRFQPAQRDGRPVPGVFQTRIEVRAEIRRVG